MPERNCNCACLLIGGNMGDISSYLKKARELLAIRCGVIRSASSVYKTAAWGLQAQNHFLNQALIIETAMDAHQLLACILAVEQEMGRTRTQRYGPRLIDIDILLFNNACVTDADLVIPHPELQNRRFALVPLNEIAGEWMHPVFKKKVSELLSECADQLDVYKI